MRLSVLVVFACSLVALPAGGSDFWERAQEPSPAAEVKAESEQPKTFGELVKKAEEHTVATEQYWGLSVRANSPLVQREHRQEATRTARLATRYLDKALDLEPDHADLHYDCARLTYWFIYQHYDDGALTTLRDEAGEHALHHWSEFERLNPDDPRKLAFVRAAGVDRFRDRAPFLWSSYQFERSIVYTKLGGQANYKKAIAEYDFLLDAAPRTARTSSWIATLLTNSAEIHMAVGNLDEAVERYRDGIEHNIQPVYLYGLAVALDRSGEHESALVAMREAIATDAKLGAAIAKKDVFFIPKGDIHYYYGLAFAAQGKNIEALLHFREYVDRIKDTRYIEHARDHIARLVRTVGAKKRRK